MPKTLTIAEPIKINKRLRNRGSQMRSVRLYKHEIKLIAEASKSLGISPNYFMRWCLVGCAKAMKNEGNYISTDTLLEE